MTAALIKELSGHHLRGWSQVKAVALLKSTQSIQRPQGTHRVHIKSYTSSIISRIGLWGE
ncbi:hypothetical protein EYF80_000296 [Liparis tanakae]|uniref:Uncharacterized protein n=1 Tax=Liparis tanakae TaxID=230148 RepID=A0A4Z2JIP7_9TELE|nr:hypothetical protein EYF80_000296 [Liparis tanakae]